MSKNNNKPKNNKARPIPVFTIHIHAMNNGELQVKNFPVDFHQAMNIMLQATKVVAAWFVQGAAENRIDEKGKDKESNIVVVPGGHLPH